MLIDYFYHHLDQSCLIAGFVGLMLWGPKAQSAHLQNKATLLIMTLAALLTVSRATNMPVQAYALFLITHTWLFRQIISQQGTTQDNHYYALLWAMAGHLLIEATDWLTLFIGGELLSLPIYAWLSQRWAANASWVAARYFLQSALFSAFFLLGVSLFYGAHQSLSFASLPAGLWTDLFWMLVLSWFFFKIGVGPFGFWVPSVYSVLQPYEIVWFGFIPKFALIAGLFQVAATSFEPVIDGVAIADKIIITAIVITGLGGHAAAWRTTSWADFLAYTAVAQNSFVLAPLLIGSQGLSLSLFFQLTYTLSLVLFLHGKKTTDGCYRLGLLTLSGLPPTPIFFAKILILQELLKNDYSYLAMFFVLMSVLALSYYLRVYSDSLRNMRAINIAIK